MDRVRPLKNEKSGVGEGTEDDLGFPTQADATEDRLACAGLFAGESGNDGSDKLVTLYREGSEWYFEDTNNSGAPGRKSLTALASGSPVVDRHWRFRFLLMGG